MEVTGFPDGQPTKVGISLADVNAGNLAFEGILLALFQREQTGKGQHVDISLLDGLLSLFTYQSQIALSSKNKVTRKGNRHPTITPYETFATKDGFINVAVGTELHWKNFCNALKLDELMRDGRFTTNSKRVEHRLALERLLTPKMKKRYSKEWINILSHADVPCGTINTLNEALRLKTVAERSMIATVHHPTIGIFRMVNNPLKLSGMLYQRNLSPPLLGEHTNAILKQIGCTTLQIASFKKRGVI